MNRAMCRSFQTEFTVVPDFRTVDVAFCSWFVGAWFLHKRGIASAPHGVGLIHERCRSAQ